LIFADTSAFYALADEGDPHHADARRILAALLEKEEGLLTHNYVLVESIALIQNRMGTEAALQFADGADAFEVEWVDRALHNSALRAMKRSRRRKISFVDQVSFLLMRSRGIDKAFSFDRDFRREGFREYSG
jgi:predicted nucleic acid-binding protein